MKASAPMMVFAGIVACGLTACRSRQPIVVLDALWMADYTVNSCAGAGDTPGSTCRTHAKEDHVAFVEEVKTAFAKESSCRGISFQGAAGDDGAAGADTFEPHWSLLIQRLPGDTSPRWTLRTDVAQGSTGEGRGTPAEMIKSVCTLVKKPARHAGR